MQDDSFPLILSLKLDKVAFDYFNDLRKMHFPPERNFIDAHLTLFHQLPSNEVVLETLTHIASTHSIVELKVNDVVFMGNGVAFKIDSPALIALHRQLQKCWRRWLIPQDKQGLWPHVTIQNKVPASHAKVLAQDLKQGFQPFIAFGVGFELWEYQNGPWKPVQSFLFNTPF